MIHKSGCLVCGKPLVNITTEKDTKCVFCGQLFSANVICEQCHFICDACHSSSANEIIRNICLNSEEKDPVILAAHIMNQEAVKMHGPEHHFLVPAVMLTAYFNTIGQSAKLRPLLEQAEKRAKNVLGGFCGFYGACGAAIGTGIFISLITGATTLSVKEWSQANMLTARSLKIIAENGGPRCCKRDVFIAIKEAVVFIKEEFGVNIKYQELIICNFYEYNKECKLLACDFYPN
jgi:hypothetical protein